MLFTFRGAIPWSDRQGPRGIAGVPRSIVMPISVTRGRLPTIFIGVWVLTGSAGRAQVVASTRDPSPHSARFVAVEANAQVEVLEWGGSGRPLVLLAGAGNTAHVFDEFAPRLASVGRVYGITRRGYGVSSAPAGGYSVDRLGTDVLKVLDALALERPVLIGHSIAGQELSFLATNYPNRLAGVIYLDGGYRYALHRPGAHDNLTDLRAQARTTRSGAERPAADAIPIVGGHSFGARRHA